ncbi:peptide methionine sulfoxide reductase [Adhaeribacter arboris]|uniref:Peptide methionine sulfoxide reductase n=1 Tax=Adhaeribacter arboris TaxID=2072846 RepID=A0A2T2YB12_9BACT|nr:alpha/beta hydrolase-fold protein [Adhaeribacter arboris]PSR52721.1 peptide methionine sulfoxide reductase [Adhaeribacter arboris]
MTLLKALLVALLSFAMVSEARAQGKKGTIVTEQLSSAILKENLVGLKTVRQVKIYLPSGYTASGKTYPVVYYCHSIYGKATWVLDEGTPIEQSLNRAFAKGEKEFILVAADFSSANIGSLYENSPVSGRWLDFITQELVPFIDSKYRTIRHRDSRAVTGDFMGGRGALKLGMTHPELFGVVYALHPVAVGVGTRPWSELGVNWERILAAKTFADLGGDKPCETFLAICQAFLPNPSRPPFYCDYFVKRENGKIVMDPAKVLQIQHNFHLEETLNESYKNLRSLRALAFDWARNDGNYDHIHAARAFTRSLEDLGIEHEAEEYRGTPWQNDRFNTRVLPFLAQHLLFEKE